jgi:hypothetical protein
MTGRDETRLPELPKLVIAKIENRSGGDRVIAVIG